MFVTAVVAAVVVLGDTPALAYTLEGPKWENTPDSGCCATINVQCSSAFYGRDRDAFDGARGAWDQSLANVYLPAANGALTVDDTYDSTVSWDGYTYSGWHQSCPWCRKYFSYAHVYLNYYYTQSYKSYTTQEWRRTNSATPWDWITPAAAC
jgi:hypothetical protein